MNEIEYDLLKVEIFTDINDNPIAPSETSGGNISHFYSQFNQLINIVFRDLTTLSELITAIDSRIQIQLPPPSLVIEEFVLANVTTSDVNGNNRVTIGTIPKSGTLKRITIDGINDEYSNYFIVIDSFDEEYYLTEWSSQTITEGFEWTFEEEVIEGQEIIFQSSVIETNRTVKLYLEVEGYAPIIPTSEPTLETFEFSGVTARDVDGDYIGTVGVIPKTGKLQKIAIDDVNDGYETFFYVEGNVKSFDAFETATEGYQWVITDDGSQDVSQGEIVTWLTTNEETGRTVYLYIYG